MNKFSIIKAAIADPDSEMPEPSRRVVHSMAMQVENLELGEIASRSVPIPDNLTLAEYDAAVKPLRVKLHNNVAPAVRRAKEAIPGAAYRTEVVDVRLVAGAALVICVTRIA